LVLLDADPLADISNTRRINAIVVGGQLMTASAIEQQITQVRPSRP
jgi:hypothetical protein